MVHKVHHAEPDPVDVLNEIGDDTLRNFDLLLSPRASCAVLEVNIVTRKKADIAAPDGTRPVTGPTLV